MLWGTSGRWERRTRATRRPHNGLQPGSGSRRSSTNCMMDIPASFSSVSASALCTGPSLPTLPTRFVSASSTSLTIPPAWPMAVSEGRAFSSAPAPSKVSTPGWSSPDSGCPECAGPLVAPTACSVFVAPGPREPGTLTSQGPWMHSSKNRAKQRRKPKCSRSNYLLSQSGYAHAITHAQRIPLPCRLRHVFPAPESTNPHEYCSFVLSRPTSKNSAAAQTLVQAPRITKLDTAAAQSIPTLATQALLP